MTKAPDPRDYRGRFTEYLDACDRYTKRGAYSGTGFPTHNSSSNWGMPHVPYAVGTDGDGRETSMDWYSYQYKPSPKYCTHDWIDTGTRLVFCKKCDGKGRLDPMSGAVEFLAEDEEDMNKKIKKGEG